MAERCEQVRELIPEVALGLAPGDERARVLAHVDACPECQAALARAEAESLFVRPGEETDETVGETIDGAGSSEDAGDEA